MSGAYIMYYQKKNQRRKISIPAEEVKGVLVNSLVDLG